MHLCIHDIRILSNFAPKAGRLMRIINLHHIKLLNNLSIDLGLACFEFRNDSLAQVDGYYVIQDTESLDLFLSLKMK